MYYLTLFTFTNTLELISHLTSSNQYVINFSNIFFLNFAIGGWIQCAGLDPSRYIVIMVSQTIYAMGQVFLLSLPPFIAGVWFGAGEVGLACAFGVFGNQVKYPAHFISLLIYLWVYKCLVFFRLIEIQM